MNMTIQPGLLRGEIAVPPSKSISHRALIAAFLSGGGKVENLAENDDISATRDCLDALKTGRVCDCRESGSTMRLLMPLALALNESTFFTGSPRLLERPMDPYSGLFAIERGQNGYSLRGKLRPGNYPVAGGVSSQFISGLMFALPLLEDDSRIILETPLESGPYVGLTLKVLEAFGIRIEAHVNSWFVPGNQKYRACVYTVEGDESAAAFWRIANALGSDILCKGLNPDSIQGDRVMTELIRSGERVIDARDCPDLVPALAVWCSFREGESRIVNAGRLRIKESDRLSAISGELNKLGAKVTELPDGLIIQGVPSLTGGEAVSHNDHRVVMALAVAATRSEKPVIIRDAGCVDKSYPDFWKHFAALGGVCS